MIAVDQNAFGAWVAFFDIEDAEYSATPEEFVERFGRFRESCLEFARARPLAAGLRVCDFGHALYFEFEDGDQSSDPLTWLRALVKELGTREFSVTAVLTHGGRWVAAVESGVLAAEPEPEAAFELVRVTRPSEPLRRALYADAAAHGSDGSDGWGSGVFVDEEAIEALKRTFKNAPTALTAAGARFFRVGS